MNQYLKYIGADLLAFVIAMLLYSWPRVAYYHWLDDLGLSPEWRSYLLAPFLLVCLLSAQWLAHFLQTRLLFPRHKLAHWKVWFIPLMTVIALLAEDIHFWYQLNYATDLPFGIDWIDQHFLMEPIFILLQLLGQILLSIVWLRSYARSSSTITPAPPAP